MQRSLTIDAASLQLQPDQPNGARKMRAARMPSSLEFMPPQDAVVQPFSHDR